MAYTLTARAPGASELTAKNRVWDFFDSPNKTRPANRRQPLQPHRKIRPTATKPASGIPYWPTRDPIEERGGLNLYGFVRNNGVNKWDYLGFTGWQTHDLWGTPLPGTYGGEGYTPAPPPPYTAVVDSFTEHVWPLNTEITLPNGTVATDLTKYDTWYKNRFPNLSKYVETQYRQELEDYIKMAWCRKIGVMKASELPKIRINGYGTGEGEMPANAITEAHFGDRDQIGDNGWEAALVLGNYSIIPSEPVISWTDEQTSRGNIQWNVRAYVVDSLGWNPKNGGTFLMGWLFGKERPAVIASWYLQGEICCAPYK